MINRLKHSINNVEFVPTNKDSFSLQTSFPDDFTEWNNSFTTEGKVVLPNEAYIELIRHLENTGVQQMPSYNININGNNNAFLVDLYQNLTVRGSQAEVTIKNFVSKDNIKANVDNLTFEYLKQENVINITDMVNIPYAVIPNDAGAKILSISLMIYSLTNEGINKVEKTKKRIGDLQAAVTPVVVPPAIPAPNVGQIIRYSLLLAMDLAILTLISIATNNLVRQAFELLQPPVRNMRAMTFDKLLTKGLGFLNMSYSSSLSSEFKKNTVLPIPVDFQNKKFFQLLLNEDTRVLNRGYPTASDTVPTLGSLIDEISKMYNISPRVENNVLILEPRQNANIQPSVNVDYNFNKQSQKENEYSLDLSKVWNTKILSYTNDFTDRTLFDNPKGLRVEYKTTAEDVVTNEYTIIKGYQDTRINFALGTRKEETALERFLIKLAKISDKIAGTSYVSDIKNREGILAISQEQFTVTKLLYQVGGKQTSDYLSKIGTNSLYTNYHLIDDSKENVYLLFNSAPIRLTNEMFLAIIQNNLITLEGLEVEIKEIDYIPEMSSANISYRVRKLEWSQFLKSRKVYEE
jgi:hypothetical protein